MYYLIDKKLKDYYIKGHKYMFLACLCVSLVLSVLSIFYIVALVFLVIFAIITLIFFITWNINKKMYGKKLLCDNDVITIYNHKNLKIIDFKLDTLINIVKQPLTLVGAETKFDVAINVYGGGLAGQAGACRHGIARALVIANEAYKADIKKAGFLTRDPRMKERKKYGLKKARKAPQFSKR